MIKVTTSELMSKGFSVTDGKWSYKGKPCVLDFWADWCVPCKNQEIILNDLNKSYSDVEFYKINVEEEYELAEIFNIKNLPTVIICSGKETKQFSGLTQKQKIEDILNKTEVLV